MPRKRAIPKKKIIPDPIYKSTYVTRLTNMIMQDGKKRTAEKIKTITNNSFLFFVNMEIFKTSFFIKKYITKGI